MDATLEGGCSTGERSCRLLPSSPPLDGTGNRASAHSDDAPPVPRRERARARSGAPSKRADCPRPSVPVPVPVPLAVTSSRSAPATAKRDEPRDAGEALPCLATTFDVPELESEFISFCQLTSYTVWGRPESESQRVELLHRAANHMHLPEFQFATAAQDICGTALLQPLERSLEVPEWIDAQSIYARLCATRLLTVREERSVTRRMHYFKYLAWQILSRPSISDWDLVRAHGLMKAAAWHRDLMVQANMRLIVSIVKKLPVSYHWHDELISDGTVALMRAVDKFDPGRGYRFCTYATKVIRRDCYAHIRARQLHKNRHRKSSALSAVRCKSPAEPDAHVEADRAHWLAWRDRLGSMMSVLTRREQTIIRARYCLGSHRRVKTLQRLSVALKISKERVRQLEVSALAKLRAAAEIEM